MATAHRVTTTYQKLGKTPATKCKKVNSKAKKHDYLIALLEVVTNSEIQAAVRSVAKAGNLMSHIGRQINDLRRLKAAKKRASHACGLFFVV